MWKSQSDLNKTILIDSDVIRHFIKGKSTEKLSKIFPNNLFILDIVENEICRSKKIRPIVKALISNGVLKRMRFPASKTTVRNEYFILLSKRGEGESACMAVARYFDDIIASNNLRDIKAYCNHHNILYLTTTDFLCVAYFKGVMSEAEIDYFLYLNLNDTVKSKIPYQNLQQYLSTNPPIQSLFNKSA